MAHKIVLRKPLTAAILATLLAAGCAPSTPSPLEQAVFVWQYAWTPAVEDALRQAVPAMDRFMVLAAEVQAKDAVPPLQIRHAKVQWNVFAGLDTPVTAVFRIEASFGKRFKDDPGAAAAALAKLARETLDAARNAGAKADQVQWDYDCPTAALGDYAALLERLRPQLPGTGISITALPTWLGTASCGKLLKTVDRYTLQAHSVGKIGPSEDTTTLCDTEKIDGWAVRAAKYGVPFDIALPTYGYALQLDREGRLAGVEAEADLGRGEGAGASVEVSANPAKLAKTMVQLTQSRPKPLKGVAWFRLPVEGDRRNWSWPVLKEVMQGRVPKPDVRAEIRTPQPYLYELWVKNAGDFRVPGKIEIPLSTSESIVAYDFLNGYEGKLNDAEEWSVTGVSPSPGMEYMAAWFRVTEGKEKSEPSFEAGTIRIAQ